MRKLGEIRLVLIICFLTSDVGCVFAQTWPDGPEKQKTLEHSAQLLLLSFDTNQIEMACDKLTNRPETVLALRGLSGEIISNFNAIAISLTKLDKNTKTYVNNCGRLDYQADISSADDSKEIYFVIFKFKNGPISQFDKRKKSDEGKVILDAFFYGNGKLRVFNDFSDRNVTCLSFYENGKLEAFSEKDGTTLLVKENGTLESYDVKPKETSSKL